LHPKLQLIVRALVDHKQRDAEPRAEQHNRSLKMMGYAPRLLALCLSSRGHGATDEPSLLGTLRQVVVWPLSNL